MLKTKNLPLFTVDDAMAAEQYKMIAFVLTMWITAFIVLFVLAPLVYGPNATKLMLFKAYATMSFPMMMASALIGLHSRSMSLKSMLLRAFVASFSGACIFSIIILIK